MTTKMIWTTCSPEKATFLCRQLLEKKLIGCVNIFEAHRSLYWWNGEICEDKEVTIIMETDEKILSKTWCRLDASLHRLAADSHAMTMTQTVI